MCFFCSAIALSTLFACSSATCSQIDPPAESLVAQANRLQHAEGVERDSKRAIEMYCRAAKLGNAQAFYDMGWMYTNGRGMDKDDGVARYLFERAADLGHAHAPQVLRYLPAVPLSSAPSCLKPEPVLPAEEPVDEYPYLRGPIFKLVHQLAPHYGVDPRLALAVIAVESGFQPKAVSPKNAQGLMQLMPETAQRFQVRNTFDPEDNIKGGLACLRWLLAYFSGNVTLVAAAYNAGERAVESHRGIPLYPETCDYVRKITRLYDKTLHTLQPHIVDASPLMTAPASSPIGQITKISTSK